VSDAGNEVSRPALGSNRRSIVRFHHKLPNH
jgi:hypothetical protein